ncbi:hypothetical protein DID88_009618 [Monilinia fructigena]|uniref:Uncharacterized protein n=1 Tax=Monilinia fructigena TaxID=38457 RepID=A0A395ITA3_9HELO|nr:hypothetical protein DID88_009618 [Monilinia fructigena]
MSTHSNSDNETADAKNTARSQGHQDSDIEGDHNNWKFRVPYKVHENDAGFKALYEGGVFVIVELVRFCMVLRFSGPRFFIRRILILRMVIMIWVGTNRRKKPPVTNSPANLIKFKSQEEKGKFNPTCHMFYSQRLVDLPDGLPKWTGLNDKSDLIEDSPPEAIQKRKREKEEEAKEEEEGKGQGKKKERKD